MSPTVHRRTPSLLLILFALCLFASLSVPAHAGTGNGAPEKGALFGAQVNRRHGQGQYESVERFERDIGRKADIVNRFHLFSQSIYRDEARHLAAGRVPLISWRATDSSADPNRARKIAGGTYDGIIRTQARAIKALGGTVLIRFNWEMDQDVGGRQHIGTPQEFIAAWRRVVRIFRNEGATNGKFVWAPRANSFNKGAAQQYWPGSTYVDWIGGSAVPINSYRDFTDIYGGFLDWGGSQNKPMLVWVGVREKSGNGSWKADFIRQANATLTRAPQVKAFVWYHALSPLGNAYWADTSAASLAAFKQMGCSDHFDQRNRCA